MCELRKTHASGRNIAIQGCGRCAGGGRGVRDLPYVQISVREDPVLDAPGWAKKLVVPDGFDTNRNPRLLLADQVIVALVIRSSPVEPFVVTAAVLVTGPVHSMSKLQCAPAETGVSNRKSAFGMSKKSLTARLAMLMVALPLPSSTGPSVGLGTVPPRFGS